MVTIEGKSAGSRKRLFDDFSVPIQNLQSAKTPTMLRDLIDNIVTDQVNAFSRRQHDSQLLKVLTQKNIIQSSRAGKITFGSSEIPEQTVDLNNAIATATEAFSDGLYFVFIDSIQINALDEHIDLKEDSRIMFIRLTLIAGG